VKRLPTRVNISAKAGEEARPEELGLNACNKKPTYNVKSCTGSRGVFFAALLPPQTGPIRPLVSQPDIS
jgi:hypothetical protein